MRLRFSRDILVAGLLMVLAGSTQALAQSNNVQSLVDRLDRLERDIKTVNVQLSRGGVSKKYSAGGAVLQASPQTLARLELRITELEGELRSATGNAEEVTYKIGQVNRRLDKLVSDIDYRLSVLEGSIQGSASGATPGTLSDSGMPSGSSSIPPSPNTAPSPPAVQSVQMGTLGQISESDLKALKNKGKGAAQTGKIKAEAPQVANAPAGVLPEGTPRERYVYAFKLLRQAKYGEAEVALREFVAKHGEDELASNARYWLGETYYVRDDFRTAAQVFIEGYRKNAKGPKAPDTLLKLGMSLARLDKKSEACATFGKLLRDFPKLATNTSKMVAKESASSGCK